MRDLMIKSVSHKCTLYENEFFSTLTKELNTLKTQKSFQSEMNDAVDTDVESDYYCSDSYVLSPFMSSFLISPGPFDFDSFSVTFSNNIDWDTSSVITTNNDSVSKQSSVISAQWLNEQGWN